MRAELQRADGDENRGSRRAGMNHVVSRRERIRIKGQPVEVNVVRAGGRSFVVTGGLIRAAELKDIWAEDVGDPVAMSAVLKKGPFRIDILKFWQRLPDVTPRYPYTYAWRHIAAIPITTHKHWFEKQITQNARNKIRRAMRQGIEVREEGISDRLVRDIMQIYNESPVRRGKPFWHYGKDFETAKRELSEDMDKSIFVTAYHEGELLGFIKFFLLDRYARTILVLDKVSRRDKSPMNSLFSKVVEICAERGTSFLVYSMWRRGNHGRFQQSVGFMRIAVPEYCVPLTIRGRLTMRLGLQHGLRGWIPERLMIPLLSLRANWYAWKCGTKAFRFRTSREQKA